MDINELTNQEVIKISLDKIMKLKTSIQIKHLEEVQTHDGLGDKFLVMLRLKDKKGTIGFLVSTDYWNCDLVVENFIFNITQDEFDKINSKNFNSFYKKQRDIANNEIKNKEKSFQARQDSIKIFKDEIKDLDLYITCKNKTTIEDVIIILDILRKNKTISNRK